MSVPYPKRTQITFCGQVAHGMVGIGHRGVRIHLRLCQSIKRIVLEGLGQAVQYLCQLSH